MCRVIFGVLICIACLISSGCVRLGPAPSVHPHSEVTKPTFCIHEDDSPRPIGLIHVERRSKQNDERIEIMDWYNKKPWTSSDQVAWEIEYAPAPSYPSDPYHKPFSCITYGKVPPGYKETAPAQPLIPERLYIVSIVDKSTRAYNSVFFIIRASDTGSPVKLEYSMDSVYYHGVHIITPRKGYAPHIKIDKETTAQ